MRRPTLVVGRGGLLGSSVAKRLNEISPETLVNRVQKLDWSEPNFSDYLRYSHVNLHEQPWCVVWTAGVMGATGSENEAVKESRNFLEFLVSLRRLSDLRQGMLILASSAGGIYGETGTQPACINSPIQPWSPYGRAKIEQEMLAEELSESGLAVHLCRISNAYGIETKGPGRQGLVDRAILSALAKTHLTLSVPFETTRDYISSRDVARCVVDLSLSPAQPGVTRHLVASGNSYSIEDLFNKVRDACGSEPRWHVAKNMRKEPLHQRFLPTTPSNPISIDEGIRRTVSSLRDGQR